MAAGIRAAQLAPLIDGENRRMGTVLWEMPSVSR